MTTDQHDWSLILKEEGDDPLAPSCMAYLDTSIDMQGAFKVFWSVMRGHYTKQGYADTETLSHKLSGLCDAASLNLIAHNFGRGLSTKMSEMILNDKYSPGDIRRLTLMGLTVKSKSDRGLVQAVTTVNNCRLPELRNKYPLSTDEGFAAQKALVTVISEMIHSQNRILKYRVLGGALTDGTAWFTDQNLATYIMDNPDKVDAIIEVISERRTGDAEVIKNVLSTESLALSSGVL